MLNIMLIRFETLNVLFFITQGSDNVVTLFTGSDKDFARDSAFGAGLEAGFEMRGLTPL